MKLKPLTKKDVYEANPQINKRGGSVEFTWKGFYPEERILEAKALLKKEVYDLYHKLNKVEVFKATNDAVCDMCEDFIIQKIDEVFNIGDEK